MKNLPRCSILAVLIVLGNISCRQREPIRPQYPALHDFIWNTAFVDVHAHPHPGLVKYEGQSYYPVLEPMISRPYFPIDRERLAVVDSLEAEALKALYGYDKDDVTPADFPRLDDLLRKFWRRGKKDGFNRALDICGIGTVFANLESLSDDFDKQRVRWVAFVDALIYPCDASAIGSISPFFRQSLQRYFTEGQKLIAEFDIEVNDLDSYLRFVDAYLENCKTRNAVALKFASAYIRTLWFDVVEKEEAELLFSQARKIGLRDRGRYKRLQDFLAGYICERAGELNLPVHFHTGFGYVATLKNLDSNPLNLESILSDMRFSQTQFVLLHAGYPWWSLIEPLLEKKNVSVEFSAVNWMVHTEQLADILYRWLSYHGLSQKIMFGTDAGTPVFFWIAAENSRRALYLALSKLIGQERMNEAQAISTAELIMRDNAVRLHRLGDKPENPE